jgi:hypothetical protein
VEALASAERTSEPGTELILVDDGELVLGDRAIGKGDVVLALKGNHARLLQPFFASTLLASLYGDGVRAWHQAQFT